MLYPCSLQSVSLLQYAIHQPEEPLTPQSNCQAQLLTMQESAFAQPNQVHKLPSTQSFGKIRIIECHCSFSKRIQAKQSFPRYCTKSSSHSWHNVLPSHEMLLLRIMTLCDEAGCLRYFYDKLCALLAREHTKEDFDLSHDQGSPKTRNIVMPCCQNMWICRISNQPCQGCCCS